MDVDLLKGYVFYESKNDNYVSYVKSGTVGVAECRRGIGGAVLFSLGGSSARRDVRVGNPTLCVLICLQKNSFSKKNPFTQAESRLV